MMLYTFYSTPEKASPIAVILLVLSVLAVLIQLICEVFGFVCRRYIEELIDTAVKDAEFLIGMLEKVQGSVEACKNAKEALATVPSRAAQKVGKIGLEIKRKLSFFNKKEKSDIYEVYAENNDDENE